MTAFLSRGTLLLSAPEMLDPNFMHTVVLMFEHDASGAMGAIVNRQLDATVADAFPHHPILAGLGLKLREGGPVGQDMLQVLHRAAPSGPLAAAAPGIDLGDGVHLGGDLSWVSERVQAGRATEDQIRFLIGYSGWGPGQLENEIATRSWLPLPPTRDIVFAGGGAEAIWRAGMGRLSGEGPSLACLPPDPSWN